MKRVHARLRFACSIWAKTIQSQPGQGWLFGPGHYILASPKLLLGEILKVALYTLKLSPEDKIELVPYKICLFSMFQEGLML